MNAGPAFRETLWFKRGDFAEPAGEEAPVPLPIEDRYLDDGTVYAEDSLQFGLHCGQTCRIELEDYATIEVVSLANTDLRTLARELRGTQTRKVAALCASALAVAGILIGVL